MFWHSPDGNFTENTLDIFRWNEFEIYWFETVVKSPLGANDVKSSFLPFPSLLGWLHQEDVAPQ